MCSSAGRGGGWEDESEWEEAFANYKAVYVVLMNSNTPGSIHTAASILNSIENIYIVSIPPSLSSPVTTDVGICATATWAQNGRTVAGGNGSGSEFTQLNGPFGLFVDENQTIYVTDRYNNRVMKWERDALSGQLVAGGKRQGTRDDQLNYPTDVVVDQDGTIYISDYGNQRVQQWSRNAQSGKTIISKITATGIARDNEGSLYVSEWSANIVKKWRVGETVGKVITSEVNHPGLLSIDLNQSVFVADQWNHRVIKVDNGTTQISIVAGDGSSGRGAYQLHTPMSVVVDQLGTVYVADTNNHRIMRWPLGATSGNVIIGGRGQGSRSDQLSEPTDLAFDLDGNLYVVDPGNDRVQKFSIDKSLC
ncbi:unnamed protein product [Didymodactylos carnosus]|uniref:Uncharacterized protein n=1 Tax=Didymodactylos carnosus TaxID=1234261 RepID=A0A814IPA1_9BILA|nr:unnamed protein product [Didymodactylos carnosus]CAF1026926.1 unnamed protein product [Didymodactylos carnosus]CAF3636133.1 unnamed protein product [Didymodactylos carnosus]CAF3798019.1 unnamed protein product [Didymodactylos carnosus]